MCGVFLALDARDYVGETRAIRIHGHATSVRLEKMFWDILEDVARREDMPLGRFVSKLHDEILERHDSVPNFASLLRVTCIQFLRQPVLADAAVRHVGGAGAAPAAAGRHNSPAL